MHWGGFGGLEEEPGHSGGTVSLRLAWERLDELEEETWAREEGEGEEDIYIYIYNPCPLHHSFICCCEFVQLCSVALITTRVSSAKGVIMGKGPDS